MLVSMDFPRKILTNLVDNIIRGQVIMMFPKICVGLA